MEKILKKDIHDIGVLRLLSVLILRLFLDKRIFPDYVTFLV